MLYTDHSELPQDGVSILICRKIAEKCSSVNVPAPAAAREVPVYPGAKIVTECEPGSEVVFLVNDRFLVELRGGNVCDLPLLYRIIDTMGLAKLQK